MQTENPIGEVRKLKGAPITVLLDILLAGQPVASKWLEAVTGYSDNTITKATCFLKELGYIRLQNGPDSRQRAWALAEGAFQLPLIHSLSTGENENRIFSDSRPATTALNTTLDKNEEIIKAAAVIKDENRIFSDSQIDDRSLALRFAGIYGSKAGELALLEWADPEYILAQYVRYLIDRQKGHKDYSTGMLIYRIQSRDPKPRGISFQYDGDGEELKNLESIRVRDMGEYLIYRLNWEEMRITEPNELL